MDLKPYVPLGALALVACTGCTMAPRYTRPKAPVPDAFAGQTGAAADLKWPDYFAHPGLQGVIRLALEGNRDLRVAALNVQKAQAYYRIQRGELSPSLGVQASGSKYRLPERMNSDGTAKVVEQDSVQVGVLSWEVDFFGRLRSLKDKALNAYLATEQAQSAARIALVSGVAQAYLAYAADKEGLDLAQGTFQAQKASHDLIETRNKLGVASDLELSQARSQMEAARADLARAQGQLAADRNALELLAGGPVPTDLLPASLEAVGDLKDVPAGLSSQVLLRRPDILMAEYQLKSANANIGAARAAFFPRVSLTAGIGTMSPDVAGLFKSGTRTWTFAPSVVAPLFAGGSLVAGVKAAKADRDIAVAQYEGAIQAAFREVADGLAQRTALADQVDAQKALVDALATTHRLANLRYQSGLDGYLNVLVAERSLYAARQGLVATRLARAANQITLYKALAGQI